jgi:trehalose utilization protein
VKVTVWGEGFLDVEALPEEKRPLNYADYVDEARRMYPDDLHAALAEGLRSELGPEATVRTAVLDDPGLGLDDWVIDDTDVLVWWSHVKHPMIDDATVERIWRRIVRDGMGLVMLHAGVESRIFRRLMGTSCGVSKLRQSDDWEAVWTISPGHPIARGVPPVFVIPTEEVYCEPFDIPTPDEIVFISSFRGGEVFRSGCCFKRGNGRIFYFRPGHESHPTYHLPEVKRVLANAATWAAEPLRPGAELWTIGDVPKATVAAHLVPEGWFRNLEHLRQFGPLSAGSARRGAGCDQRQEARASARDVRRTQRARCSVDLLRRVDRPALYSIPAQRRGGRECG